MARAVRFSRLAERGVSMPWGVCASRVWMGGTLGKTKDARGVRAAGA